MASAAGKEPINVVWRYTLWPRNVVPGSVNGPTSRGTKNCGFTDPQWGFLHSYTANARETSLLLTYITEEVWKRYVKLHYVTPVSRIFYYPPVALLCKPLINGFPFSIWSYLIYTSQRKKQNRIDPYFWKIQWWSLKRRMLSCILCIFQTSISASSFLQLLWYSGPCLLYVHQPKHHLPSIVTLRCFTLSFIFTEMLSYLPSVDIKDDDFIVQIHLALVSLTDTSPLAVFIRMGTAEATSCYYDFKQAASAPNLKWSLQDPKNFNDFQKTHTAFRSKL